MNYVKPSIIQIKVENFNLMSASNKEGSHGLMETLLVVKNQ